MHCFLFVIAGHNEDRSTETDSQFGVKALQNVNSRLEAQKLWSTMIQSINASQQMIDSFREFTSNHKPEAQAFLGHLFNEDESPVAMQDLEFVQELLLGHSFGKAIPKDFLSKDRFVMKPRARQYDEILKNFKIYIAYLIGKSDMSILQDAIKPYNNGGTFFLPTDRNVWELGGYHPEKKTKIKDFVDSDLHWRFLREANRVMTDKFNQQKENPTIGSDVEALQ